jgi:hypothetical protein
VLFSRSISAFVLLFSSLCAPGSVHAAQAACDSLAQQVTAADHDLEGMQQSATPQLLQAASLGAVASANVLASANTIPGETPELAQLDVALLVQIGMLAQQAANQSSGLAADAFFSNVLASALPNMETSLVQLQRVVPFVQSAQVLQGLVQDVRLTASKAQATQQLRDDLRTSLQACQGNTDPCPLPFMRADRSVSPPGLRPLWSQAPDETLVDMGGGQWEVHFAYPADGGTSGPSIVDVVDTFSCTDQGLAKIGRQAVQTFGDGTTAAWGEDNYQGVLYPRSIAPGSAWDWTATQWSGDPGIAETWHTHVSDVGRETVGSVELIHLHVTTVTDTDTFESDEYVGRR